METDDNDYFTELDINKSQLRVLKKLQITAISLQNMLIDTMQEYLWQEFGDEWPFGPDDKLTFGISEEHMKVKISKQ